MNSTDLIAAAFILLIGGGVGISISSARAKRRILRERSRLNNAHRKEIKTLESDNALLMQGQETILIVVDNKKSIVLANNAANDFFHQTDLHGKSIDNCCIIPELRDLINDSIQSQEPIKQDIQANVTYRGNTEELFLSVSIKGVEDGARGPLTRVAIQDITTKRLHEIIHKDFVANASHELRTPLTIISGYVETLLDDDEALEDKETTRYFLSIMKRHTERLTRIVEEMLMITKLDSGLKGVLKVKPFLLRECIDDCLSNLDQVIKEKETVVTVSLSDPDIEIIGDQFYWSQILFNIIENAIKQNPDQAVTIEVGCKTDGGKLHLWISDNGTGIPAEDLPFIFKRFYRVAKDHSQQKIKGTGLGLSIVKRAVEAHEGTISCQSEQGVQTTFEITIPHKAP